MESILYYINWEVFNLIPVYSAIIFLVSLTPAICFIVRFYYRSHKYKDSKEKDIPDVVTTWQEVFITEGVFVALFSIVLFVGTWDINYLLYGFGAFAAGWAVPWIVLFFYYLVRLIWILIFGGKKEDESNKVKTTKGFS